ncbi:coiled-coil domain-containing protein 57 [Porphyrio hochstetteri]
MFWVKLQVQWRGGWSICKFGEEKAQGEPYIGLPMPERNCHVGHQHEEYVNLQHDLERKIQELAGEFACQKQVHEELARAAKEKDAMPASVGEAQGKQLKRLKQQIKELQMRHKSLEIELCRREWSHSACLREKEALIRKYKQQLFLAAEGQGILEQSKMQELGWQQLCENADNNCYQKSEELIQSSSSAREQAEADLQKTDYRLHEGKTDLSALTVEREQRIQTSFHHRMLPEGEKQVFQHDDNSSLSKDTLCLEIKKLQEQNANLRAAVAQMRKEMECLDEQMLSSLPLTENTQPAEQGDNSCHRTLSSGLLSTNKIPAGTTLSSKIRSTNLDYGINPDTGKSFTLNMDLKDPKSKVPKEKMVGLGQQFQDTGYGVGLHCGVSCTPEGMQNTLKEAARKISILSQEKQQLIEMGNSLRAELGMVLKEGLGHPVSSKCCRVCITCGSLFPRELLKRTQCQLSALRHLQHRLTTQKLQYANPPYPSRISPLIACPGLKDEEASSSCGEETELPSAEVHLDFAIEDHGPETGKADTSPETGQSQPLRPSPRRAQQVQLASSTAPNFCQGIWPTLEMGSSPSALRHQKHTDQVESEVTRSIEQSEESQQGTKAKNKHEMPAADLRVRGTRLEVQQKLKSRNLSCARPIKQKIPSNMPKIRNYNIKD